MTELTGQDFFINLTRYTEQNKNRMKDFHHHDQYEIYYLLSGERKYLINYNVYNIQAGDLVLISPRVLHMTKTLNGNENHERIVMNFSDEWLTSLGEGAELLRGCFRPPHLRIPPARQQEVADLLFSILTEHKNGTVFSEQLIRNDVYQLLVTIYRIIGEEDTEPILDISNPEISLAAKYICQNFEERITLGQMAELCHMNPSYFSRLFKQVMGISFVSYLNAVRIREASSLLLSTSRPILDIANSCGFSGVKHFCSVFRNTKGMTAGEYRKKGRKNSAPQAESRL